MPSTAILLHALRILTMAAPFRQLVTSTDIIHAAISADRPGHAFMKIGYARVSTKRQNLDFQIHALEQAGCDVIVAEKVSGRAKRRPGLAAAIASCAAGDTLTVWKIDRLGRDVIELVQFMKLVRAAGAGLQVLTGRASEIDIETVEGRALFSIFAAFADLEREWGRERTIAGVRMAQRRRAMRRCKSRRPECPTAEVSLRRAFGRLR